MNYLSAFGTGDITVPNHHPFQRDAEDIVAIWRYRRDRSMGVTGRMRRIRDIYNGDMVLPFDDDAEPAVANLILVGIDQKAMRIASTMPQVWFPPEKPGQDKSEKQAIRRRDAVMGWWTDNKMDKLLRQRARYLIAYGSTPMVIRPHPHMQMPSWQVRNPLACYPAEDLNQDFIPNDMITAFNKTFGWFKTHYPDIAYRYYRPDEVDDFTQCVLLEYSDPEQVSLIFAGIDPTWEPGYQTLQYDNNTWGGVACYLHCLPNLAQKTLGVIPSRVTLDRTAGEFDQMVGIYGAQAKLAALELAAVEKDIFPDTYLVSRPNETASFVSGPHDGRSGQVNIVRGGDVQNLTSPAGYQVQPLIDRLERSTRIVGGIPAEFGGESTQNVRTGRRGDAILSAIIDHPIAEAQEQIATSLEYENKLAIDISKAWWGSTKTSYYYAYKKKINSGDYTPNDLFDGPCVHTVSYPVAGADLNALIVGVGQRIGLGTMSKESAAELDPLIDDPELEKDRITAEALETAMLASIQNGAAEGTIPPKVVARVIELVKSDEYDVASALGKATEEAQAEQQAAQEAPTGMEALMAQAAAQGTGEPQQIPQVPEAGQSLQNLAGLANTLRNSNRSPDMGGGY